MADFSTPLTVAPKRVEDWMKIAFLAAAFLLLPLIAGAQTSVTIAPQSHPPAAPARSTAPEFPFPGGFKPPAGLFDQFWNDPAVVAELRLTDVQRKQFQDAVLQQQLSLIDSGADAPKALAHLAALLEADQLDEAAYKQQVNNLAVAAGKLVHDAGEMAVTPRRVLTVEQWHKLQSLERAKRFGSRTAQDVQMPPGKKP